LRKFSGERADGLLHQPIERPSGYLHRHTRFKFF
jgi:hypothetical protein